MKKFLSNDFLLDSPTAQALYDCVKDLPIIDYHCHLSAEEIYKNQPYSSITEVWLGADHYKWRALRNMGVDENLITGKCSDYDKFVAWATNIPYMAGHPLYTFSMLELKNYFGITEPLNSANAYEIYTRANDKLKELTPRKIIEQSRVEVIVTTNDPIEDLTYHKKLQDEGYAVKALPAFRPDRALGIEKDDFRDYIELLATSASCDIKNLSDLKKALIKRLDYFRALGCVASDHGLDVAVFNNIGADDTDRIFRNALSGNPLTQDEIDGYKTHILLFLASEYVKHDIVMEIHFGCLRNANTHALATIGKDAGFDCMRTETGADSLYALLDKMATLGTLPKTLLFSLNPADNDVLVTMMGAFNGGGCKGKVQQGSAWWFNDNKPGIEKQIATYASGAPIDTFLGMLTDSRSLLSYARHEFFRRILCNYLGGLVERGEYPESQLDTLKEIAQNVSYKNVKHYFNFN